jgi:hypothetical protein
MQEVCNHKLFQQLHCSRIAEAEAAVSVNEKKWLVQQLHGLSLYYIIISRSPTTSSCDEQLFLALTSSPNQITVNHNVSGNLAARHYQAKISSKLIDHYEQVDHETEADR